MVIETARCRVPGAECLVRGAGARRADSTWHQARGTRHRAVGALLAAFVCAIVPMSGQRQTGFTVDQILSVPQPDNLVAAPSGAMVAWTFNERGVRNIYVAAGPDFKPRRLTAYTTDDGQELTNLSFSGDGRTMVYVRGGDHGSNRGGAPNPSASPVQPRVQGWSVPVAGGEPKLLGEGDDPLIAPDSARVLIMRERGIFVAPLDGSKAPQLLFYARGTSESPV